MPKLLFLPACIYLSGVQTRVKEEQIDTPSGSCLAFAVCGTYDGFYREKTPKHKMAEVSKFRKSQKWERAADLCCLNVRDGSGAVDLDAVRVGVLYQTLNHKKCQYLLGVWTRVTNSMTLTQLDKIKEDLQLDLDFNTNESCLSP